MNSTAPYDFSATAMDWSNPGSVAIAPVNETPAQIAAAESSSEAVALNDLANSIPTVQDTYNTAAGAVSGAVSSILPSASTLLGGGVIIIIILVLGLLVLGKVETL